MTDSNPTRRDVLKSTPVILSSGGWLDKDGDGSILDDLLGFDNDRPPEDARIAVGTESERTEVDSADIDMFLALSGTRFEPDGNGGWAPIPSTGPDPSFDGVTINESINTEQGFISGLLVDYVDATTAAVQPGQCIADDDLTVIDVDSTLNIDLSVTGAGGRQSGLSEQASSWYELYVIADADGSTPAGFAVEESQTLSNPKAVERSVGWIRNNSTSDISPFFNESPGRWYWDDRSNHTALDTTTPATSTTTVDLSNHIPPTAEEAQINLFGKGDGTAGRSLIKTAHNGAAKLEAVEARGWAGHSIGDATATGVQPCDDAQKITYITRNLATAKIFVIGWIAPR